MKFIVLLLLTFTATAAFGTGNHGKGNTTTHTYNADNSTNLNSRNTQAVRNNISVSGPSVYNNSESGSRSDSSAQANSGDSASSAESSVGDTNVNLSPNLTGGNSTSSAGDSTSGVGDTSATSGDSTSSNVLRITKETAASRAATVIGGVCQSGMSAQGIEGGLSVLHSDQLCDYWRAAEIAKAAYEYELTLAYQCDEVTCSINCPVPGYVAASLDVCETETAKAYLDDYRKNLAMAQDLINDTRVTAIWDRIAGQLMKPAAIIGLLLLL